MSKTQNLIPVVLLQSFRGRNPGETSGFKPALASDLVSSGAARWYDDEARQAAERAGFAAKAKEASLVDAEVKGRAEKMAAEIVAVETAAMEEKMADVVSANKKGGAAHAKFAEALDGKDAEIAKLKAELAGSG